MSGTRRCRQRGAPGHTPLVRAGPGDAPRPGQTLRATAGPTIPPVPATVRIRCLCGIESSPLCERTPGPGHAQATGGATAVRMAGQRVEPGDNAYGRLYGYAGVLLRRRRRRLRVRRGRGPAPAPEPSRRRDRRPDRALERRAAPGRAPPTPAAARRAGPAAHVRRGARGPRRRRPGPAARRVGGTSRPRSRTPVPTPSSWTAGPTTASPTPPPGSSSTAATTPGRGRTVCPSSSWPTRVSGSARSCARPAASRCRAATSPP